MLIEAMKRKCPVCGVPRVTSFILRWRGNGTITMFLREDFRAVVLRQVQIEALVQRVEDKLGVSLEHIIFEAQRDASKATFDNTFDGIPGLRLLTKINRFKRRMVEQLNLIALTCGECFSETVEYVPGKRGVARMKNPYYMPLMAASVVGAFESMEGVPYTSKWEETGPNTFLMTVEATSGRSEVAQRMQAGVVDPLPGNNKHEKCPRCRAPKALSQLSWDLDESIITDTRTGSRVLILDGYSLVSVFRELVAELGEEVQQLIVDVQREWTVENVAQLNVGHSDSALSSGELEKAYSDYLSTLPLDGMGNPVSFEMADGKIEVTVENPYSVYILAGTLQGLYEALEKVPSRVDWNEAGPGAVHFTVGPA
ncbi:MAG TPA: hypothetical protein VIK22_02675 [Candidatus Anoxymicrobiaceae bacterium]